MDFLKHIISLISLSLLLTGCYKDFEPDIEQKPALCMNSLITAGEPIRVNLTRTWRFSSGNPGQNLDISVKDAIIELYVNDILRGTLDIVTSPDDGDKEDEETMGQYYQSDYRPAPGDRIRLRAVHPEYGEATASTEVPLAVPLTGLEPNIAINNYIGSSYANFYDIALSFKARFTDPADRINYYAVEVDCHNPEPVESDIIVNVFPDGQAPLKYAGALQYFMLDYDAEPIFSEHLSTLDHIFDSDSWGFSIFSDKQINGGDYSLTLNLSDTQYIILNPEHIDSLYHSTVTVTLSSISSDYYDYIISLWEHDSGVHGQLGNAGFADPVFLHSNVSTGAGIVAARTKAVMVYDLADWARALPHQGLN